MHRRSILGQTFDEVIGMPGVCGDLFRLLGHGAGAWLGIYVGTKLTGVPAVVGWIMGIGMGIAATLDVFSIVTRVAGTHPPILNPEFTA
jgi:hypothetical protein